MYLSCMLPWKTILLLLSALLPVALYAQPRLRWAVSTALDVQSLGIQPLNDLTKEPPAVESPRNGTGGSIGLLSSWRLGPKLALQAGAQVSQVSNTVVFRTDNRVAHTRHYRFTDLELPLHLVLANQNDDASPLQGVLRFGARLSWSLAEPGSDQLALLRERLAVDAGLGVQIRLRRFLLQPEFVYSHGLTNLHDYTNRPYDPLVGRVVRDRMSIRLLLFKR